MGCKRNGHHLVGLIDKSYGMCQTLVRKFNFYLNGEFNGEAVVEKVLFVINIFVHNVSSIALCSHILNGVCSLLDKAVEVISEAFLIDGETVKCVRCTEQTAFKTVGKIKRRQTPNFGSIHYLAHRNAAVVAENFHSSLVVSESEHI